LLAFAAMGCLPLYFLPDKLEGLKFFLMFLSFNLMYPLALWLERHYFNKQRIVFDSPLFAEFFTRNRFTRILIFKSSWKNTLEAMSGEINGYHVVCSIEHGKILVLYFPLEWMKIGRRRYRLLEKRFRVYHAQFDIGGIIMRVPLKKLPSTTDFSSLAIGLAAELEKEGFVTAPALSKGQKYF
jgi:hypothetical protein